MDLLPGISERTWCRRLGLNRSTLWRRKTVHSAAVVDLEKMRQDKALTYRIKELVNRHPS